MNTRDYRVLNLNALNFGGIGSRETLDSSDTHTDGFEYNEYGYTIFPF